MLRTGKDITLTGYGVTVNALLDCAGRLEARGIQAQVLKLNTITPLDMEPVAASVKKTGRLLVAEEAAPGNCVGRRLAAGLLERGISARLALVNTGPGFVTHGSVAQLRALVGLDGESLYHKALEVCGHGNG